MFAKRAASLNGILIHPMRLVHGLQTLLSDDMTLCLEMGSFHIWLARHLYSFRRTLFGKHIVTKRKVAWYGDSNYLYTYSNTTKQALSWTKELLELKQIVELKQIAETKFNSCLLNLYHSENEGTGWHSDDEESIQRNSTIASLSLGAERKFSFKHKQTKQTISSVLEHGSLLIMKYATQAY
jgi:alkylated DNA repair dioxygenase AlkB